MDNGTELQALRDENALLKQQLHESLSAIKSSELLSLEVRRLELLESHRRKADGYRLPSGIYEMLEDVGILEAVRVSMQRLWHKDLPAYRKAMLEVTKLQWDLREKLKRNL